MAVDLFSTVQPGFEEALEQDIRHLFDGGEILESLPGWRVFRLEGGSELERFYGPPSSFSRSWGIALGRGKPPLERLTEPFVLQCWARREFPPGAREKRVVPIEVELRNEALRREFRDSGLPLLEGALPVQAGTLVLDAIRLRPGDWVWGIHLHAPIRVPHPGGELPWPAQEVPSRAYLKCEEAIRVTEMPLSPGETVLELGSAPGGALLALLERGLDVIAVDPAELAGPVESFARANGRRLTHLRRRAEALHIADLPARVDWLFSDMNVAPEELLVWVDRWLPELQARGLRAAFLTLKLTDRAFIQGLRELAARKRACWGASGVLLRQLSQNRKEILLHAAFGPKGGT
ncbi:MAG: hypothetical protein NDJ89_08960 [Oligoflexia bacterium]|nr:hypothetical protein [Oligoflexia bacterium]